MSYVSIGHVQKAHGLNGAMKVKMYFPYSCELLSKYDILINDSALTIKKVFGIVKDICIVEFVEVDHVDLVYDFKDQVIEVNLGDDLTKYSVGLIGLKVYRGLTLLGYVDDISWVDGMEYLLLEDYLISLNEVKKIQDNKIFLM